MAAPEFKNPTLIKFLPHAGFIRDERNLVRIGFFSAKEERKGDPPFMRSYTIPMIVNGIRSVQTIALESTRGLPSTADRDKWYAFVRIAERQRDFTGTITNPIRFGGAEFLRELDVCDSGRNYDEILAWGERMAHTTISSRAVIYFSSSDTYSDDTLHVFDRFKRLKQVAKKTSTTRRASRTEMYEVYLADWLLENLNLDFTIPEDLVAYKNLVRPIAKSIFPLLTWWFSSNGCQEFKKNYTDLCLLLGITRFEYRSDITRTLRDSLAELVNIGYLSRWQIQKNEEGTDYNLVLWPGPAVIQAVKSMPSRIRSGALLLESPNGEPDDKIQDEPVDADEVVAVLLKHGIFKEAALQLLKEFDPGKILDFAEYMTERVSNDDKKVIKNAAGLLIHLLKQGRPIPPGFISSRMRRKLEAEKNAAIDQRIHSQTQEIEYISWREEQVETEVALRYPGEAYELKIAEVIAQEKKSSKTFVGLLRNQQVNLAASQIRVQVRESMMLPNFDMWCANHLQYGLFQGN